MKKIILIFFLILYFINIHFAQLCPTLKEPAPPDITASSNLICRGETVNLSINGTYNFLWNTGQTTSSINVNPAITTAYSVTLTHTSGCSSVASKTVATATPPNAGVGTTAAMCKSEVFSTTDLFALLTGEQVGGTWNTNAFPSGMTTVAVNAKITLGVLQRKGFPAGTYIFQYTVTGTSPCPNDTENVTITINPCCTPTICMPMAAKRQ